MHENQIDAKNAADITASGKLEALKACLCPGRSTGKVLTKCPLSPITGSHTAKQSNLIINTHLLRGRQQATFRCVFHIPPNQPIYIYITIISVI